MAHTYTGSIQKLKTYEHIWWNLNEKNTLFFKVESARIQISSQKPREDKLNDAKTFLSGLKWIFVIKNINARFHFATNLALFFL